MYNDNWRARANCRSMDPEQMQPERATLEDVREATLVCGTGTSNECPVWEQCRQLAERQAGGNGCTAYGVHAGQWFGELPTLPSVYPCTWCGEDMEAPGGGRPRLYCGAGCRVKAQRARDAAGKLSA